MKNTILLALLLLGSGAAHAQELTALGAEVAANADGSIPAWSGGLKVSGSELSDPFASESSLLRISPEN